MWGIWHLTQDPPIQTGLMYSSGVGRASLVSVRLDDRAEWGKKVGAQR